MPTSYLSIIQSCFNNIRNDIIKTPLVLNKRLSLQHGANIYLKREDLQNVRSFKIRGAINKIKKIGDKEVVTASAGNHAQGVAYSCRTLNKKGHIFVPETTPIQKIDRIRFFGGDNIRIEIVGNNFNECLHKSLDYSKKTHKPFIHPYDDQDIINGQATLAHEIYKKIEPDAMIACVGGAGLISGLSLFTDAYNKFYETNIGIYGVEPDGASSLKTSLEKKERVYLDNLDTFVDGASVAQVGQLNFDICSKNIDKKSIFSVGNEKICHEIVKFYQEDGILLEPAGVLSVAGLDQIMEKNPHLKNKDIVCVLSGGNNDISRYGEIMELNLKHQDLKHYFIMKFIQKPGQLKLFINDVLGEHDDIVRFEYIKKTNKQFGDVLVGIELKEKEAIKNIICNLDKLNFKYKKIESKQDQLVYDLLI